MDIKLTSNDNGFRPTSTVPFTSEDFPHETVKKPKKSGKRGKINRFMGFTLLFTAISLMVFGFLCWASYVNIRARPQIYLPSHVAGKDLTLSYPDSQYAVTNALSAKATQLYYLITTAYATGELYSAILTNGFAYADERSAALEMYTVEILQEDAAITYDYSAQAAESVTAPFAESLPEEAGIPSYETVPHLFFNAAHTLFSDREITFYLTLADNTVITNIPAYESLSTHLTDAVFVYSLTNPVLDLGLFDFEGTGAQPLATWFTNLNIRYGELYIPGDIYQQPSSNIRYWLLNDEMNVSSVQTQRALENAFRFSVLGFIVVVIVALLFYKKSVFWAVGLLFAWYNKQPLLLKTGLTAVGMLYMVHLYVRGSTPLPHLLLSISPLLVLCFSLTFLTVLYMLLSCLYVLMLLPNPKAALADTPEARWLRGYAIGVRCIWKTRSVPLLLLVTFFHLCLLPLLFVTVIFFMEHSYSPEQTIFFSISVFLGMGLIIMLLALLFNYAQISVYTELMAGGAPRPHIETGGWFSKPLRNLGKINDGLRRAIDEALKSERHKTELITNVSHDLKTPLTAIINYVALLKEMPQSETTAMEYIDVIDKKTQRLKVLIDDLFEVTQLSSGADVFHPAYINAADLLKQTLGELSEKIETSGIPFISRFETEKVYLYVDGKKMWRVFDNLINNILKYALAGTRAYISVEEEDRCAIFTFKNISQYPLDFNPQELGERFKRGDASRSTEGSGLGLSIARSIVERSGGKMQLTTDGDLFKVTLIFQRHERA